MTSAERVAAWLDFGSAATAAPAAAAPIRPRRVMPLVAISPPWRRDRGGRLSSYRATASSGRAPTRKIVIPPGILGYGLRIRTVITRAGRAGVRSPDGAGTSGIQTGRGPSA